MERDMSRSGLSILLMVGPSTTLSVARLADGAVTELATGAGRFLSIERWWPMGCIETRDRATYWLNPETVEIRYDPN